MTVLKSLATLEQRLMVLQGQIWCPAGPAVLRPFAAGKTSEIYLLEWPGSPEFVVKIPPIANFHEEEKFLRGYRNILREIDLLQRLYGNMFVNRAEIAQYRCGIPIITFRRRSESVRHLIANKFVTDDFTRLTVLYMISRGLLMAAEANIHLHQDLKPENILIDFVAAAYNDDVLLPIIPRIHDFELANAIIGDQFRGFRPYLPAEAFKTALAIVPDNRFDVYSLSVIAHELLTGGYHPIGIHMSKYASGYVKPYDREVRWKDWTRHGKRVSDDIPLISDDILASVTFQAFAPEPADRPSMLELNEAFAEAASRIDALRWSLTREAIYTMEAKSCDEAMREGRFCDAATTILREHWVQPENMRIFW